VSFHPEMQYEGAGFHKSERRLPPEGQPFALTPERRQKFEELASHYPPEERKSAILYALFMVQEQQGWISANAMRHVAEVIGCTPAEVEDVVSYYAMFYRQPVGKYVLQVCRTLSCALRGAERVTEAFGEALGIGVGETDATGTFTLVEVECLGACDRAPVVMINDGWHECLKPEEAGRLLDEVRARGEAALSGCVHKVEKS
jgi:NADH-quinone oxidoreductase E subunit